MTAFPFNTDILLEVLSCADWQTICVLMRTCHLLNRHGAKHLLAHGVSFDLGPGFWRDMMMFLRFLSGDPEKSSFRLSHLRILSLSRDKSYGSPGAPSEADLSAVELLAELLAMLARSGRLRVLDIDDLEDILRIEPGLAHAIAQVASLRILRVTDVGPRGAGMLRALRSTLREADITMHSDMVNHAALDNTRPTFLLYGSQESLRQLRMSLARGAHNGPRYPRMARFHLDSADKPRIYHYVYAFPNLQHLSTSNCNATVYVSRQEFELLRSENRREQDLHGSWSSLQSFEGPLSTLYLLAPSCTIRTLKLHERDGYPMEMRMLRSILDAARPQHMKLSFHGGRWLLDEVFLSTWVRPALGSLAHLHLDVGLVSSDDNDQENDHQLDFTRSMDNVVSRIVASLPSLRSFHFTLHCSSIASSVLERIQISKHPLLPIEQAVLEWDMDALAHRVRTAGTDEPLRTVDLRVYGHRTRADQGVQLGPKYTLEDVSSDAIWDSFLDGTIHSQISSRLFE